MKPNKYDTLVQAINDLKYKGYDSTFNFEDGKMRCLQNEKKYTADDMSIDEQYRFEGMSNPGDSSIVFGVRCTDGIKGTIVSAYGPYADIKLIQFMNELEMKNAH